MQKAMLLVPACYAASGVAFLVTEQIIKAEARDKAAKQKAADAKCKRKMKV